MMISMYVISLQFTSVFPNPQSCTYDVTGLTMERLQLKHQNQQSEPLESQQPQNLLRQTFRIIVLVSFTE